MQLIHGGIFLLHSNQRPEMSQKRRNTIFSNSSVVLASIKKKKIPEMLSKKTNFSVGEVERLLTIYKEEMV